MYSNFQLFCVGTAAVLDTVLLLTLLERRNWRYAILPVVLLALAAWLMHAGAFVHLLLAGLAEGWAIPVHFAALAVFVVGVLLLPSAMLHGAWRVHRSGLAPNSPFYSPYLLAYIPLLAVFPVLRDVHFRPDQTLLTMLEPWGLHYILGVSAINLAAASIFLSLRRRGEPFWAGRFFTWLAAYLFLKTAILLVLFFAMPKAEPGWGAAFFTAMLLPPILLAVLFVYFVIRFRFMGLILERTAVYGAILVGAMLFHRLIVQGWTESLTDRFRVDFGVIEGVAALALILLYHPFRQRTAEALRYLMGSHVAGVRERSRRLAVEMSSMAGRPPMETLDWFAAAVRDVLNAHYVAGWLINPSGRITTRSGDHNRLSDAQAMALHRTLREAKLIHCSWRDAPNQAVLESLRTADASLAVVMSHQRIDGLILFGRLALGRDLGEEEANDAILLVEQLAISLNNNLLQSERLAAEQRALQNEKLSTLGLLASSIAHEVKNPLSSIKTIATVLRENLGPDGDHAEDLRLILGEVDRLSHTTRSLLEFARPPSNGDVRGSVSGVLTTTARILQHLAKQRGVTLETQLGDGLPPVRADDAALREIFFNLLVNSLEAVNPGGKVSVSLHAENGCVVADIQDTGPGIPPEVQDRIFEPFFTTKPAGTGLGLYVVSRRIQELGGEIRCESAAERGTSFTVRLPCV